MMLYSLIMIHSFLSKILVISHFLVIIGILRVYFDKINFDDANFDKYDLETFIHVRLMT